MGRSHRCGGVTAFIAPGPVGLPLVGVVAGKRIGSAVMRNRAKRRIREAAAQCSLQPDTVYVLVAHQEVLAAEFSDLVGWIGSCANKERG